MPNNRSISAPPIRSKSSGTMICPAMNPSRRTRPASGASSGTTLTIGLLALGRYGGTNGNFVLVGRRGCETDGAYEAVERGAEALIEAIEEGKLLARQGGVAGDGV